MTMSVRSALMAGVTTLTVAAVATAPSIQPAPPPKPDPAAAVALTAQTQPLLDRAELTAWLAAAQRQSGNSIVSDSLVADQQAAPTAALLAFPGLGNAIDQHLQLHRAHRRLRRAMGPVFSRLDPVRLDHRRPDRHLLLRPHRAHRPNDHLQRGRLDQWLAELPSGDQQRHPRLAQRGHRLLELRNPLGMEPLTADSIPTAADPVVAMVRAFRRRRRRASRRRT